MKLYHRRPPSGGKACYHHEGVARTTPENAGHCRIRPETDQPRAAHALGQRPTGGCRKRGSQTVRKKGIYPSAALTPATFADALEWEGVRE